MKKLLFLSMLFICLSGCSKMTDEQLSESEKQYPDQESWSSQITLTKDGQKRALVDAGHLTKYNNMAYVSMDENVEIDFFNNEERHLSHLKSKTAIVYESTNDLIAKGDVVVVSDSGVTLYTQELKWNHEKERILSEGFIIFVTEQDTLNGVGFESDSDLKNWIIRKPTGVTEREFND
ncbi:MAG: LPS export ABC transporter periplasmic protein LptC [Candidatus Marinimicrobia bacterium CG08_land_8_20_14_0_20_45_22]|nr:MAG: LPS export ABC transporter periplasmic protein LptC [Candidatus Marinimicrobia bacterium CG08_land_8_20_14_0_20_45_22]